MAATSEASKEYMVNAISMGIKPIGMKLCEDIDLEASYNINYILMTLIRGRLTSEAAKKCHSVQCNAFGPHDKTSEVLLNGCLITATSEAIKE